MVFLEQSCLCQTTARIFKASALWTVALYKLICPYVCVSVCQSVCLFTFEVPFKCLFAPIFQSRMSKKFRDFESFGEKKWKEVVSYWKTNKGCKIAPQN